MIIFEGDTSSDDWVMHYTITLFGTKIERRPATKLPPKQGLYFVDFGTRLSPGRASAGIWDGERWLRTNKQPFKATVTHWSSEASGDPIIQLPKLANE